MAKCGLCGLHIIALAGAVKKINYSISILNLLFAAIGLIQLSFAPLSYAQVTAPSIEIKSLFENSSYVVNTLIPFRVQNSNLQPTQIKSYSVLNTSTDICRLLKDPFIDQTFHLKCIEPVDAIYLAFQVVLNQTLQNIKYGPIKIQRLSTELQVIEPQNPPSPPLNLDKYNLGQSQFSQYCTGCHHRTPSNATDITGTNETFIKNTIIIGNLKNMATTNGADVAYRAGDLNLNALIYYINNYGGE